MRWRILLAMVPVSGLLVISPAEAALRPSVSLAKPGVGITGQTYTVHGRLAHTGSRNNKTVRLQVRTATGWVTYKRKLRLDDGAYAFRVRGKTAGNYRLRSVVLRSGRVLDRSAVRTLHLRASYPTSAIPAAPSPGQPPAAAAGTGATQLSGFFAGQLLCSLGVAGVQAFAPSPNGETINSYVDWYRDYLWRWNGSRWTGKGFGPWSYKPRGLTFWTRYDTQESTQSFTYRADRDRYYAVVQFFYDGQFGGFWPQQATSFLTPEHRTDYTCLAG